MSTGPAEHGLRSWNRTFRRCRFKEVQVWQGGTRAKTDGSRLYTPTAEADADGRRGVEPGTAADHPHAVSLLRDPGITVFG